MDQAPTTTQAELETIIRAKRPQPLRSVDELMALDVFPTEAEVDEFARSYREDRQASTT